MLKFIVIVVNLYIEYDVAIKKITFPNSRMAYGIARNVLYIVKNI